MSAPWKITSQDWPNGSDRLLGTFARLINSPASCVALVPSVSYGIAVAARNIPVEAGDNIVVIDQEYPSNYYSWRRLARKRGAELRTAVARADQTLTAAIVPLIDRRTAVVATSTCHWTDGSLIDLRRVGAVARTHGAALVNYTDTYKAGAARFGQGESAQFYLSSMALAALEQIEQWTPSRIQRQLGEWTTELAMRAKSLGFSCSDPANRVGHMIGLKALLDETHRASADKRVIPCRPIAVLALTRRSIPGTIPEPTGALRICDLHSSSGDSHAHPDSRLHCERPCHHIGDGRRQREVDGS